MRTLTEAVRTTWHSIDADSVNALRAYSLSPKHQICRERSSETLTRHVLP